MNKIYFTSDDVSQMLGVSRGQAYKIIKRLNEELEKKKYIVVAGKVPKKYFSERYYGGVMEEMVLIGKETLRLGWKNTYLRCKLERKSQ